MVRTEPDLLDGVEIDAWDDFGGTGRRRFIGLTGIFFGNFNQPGKIEGPCGPQAYASGRTERRKSVQRQQASGEACQQQAAIGL
jgi:hypothetical protein